MAHTSCVVCKRAVPPHFQSAGITQCLPCQAVEIKLAQLLSPSDEPSLATGSCLYCASNVTSVNGRFCESCKEELRKTVSGGEETLLTNLGKPWMIKSASRISGPFSSGEIIAMIKKREVVALDEIKVPQRSWNLVRDVRTFAEALRDVGRAAGPGDETTSTNVLDKTVTITEKVDREITPVVAGREVTEAPIIKEFGTPSKRDVWKRVALAAGVAVVVIATGMLLKERVKGFFRGGPAPGTSFESVFAEAKAAQKEGSFNAALDLFRDAHAMKPDHIEATLRMAILQINEGQARESARLLDTILPLDSSGTLKREILTGLALAAWKNADVEGARKHFKAAVEADPSFVPAGVGVATFELSQGNAGLAREILKGASAVSEADPVVILTWFTALSQISPQAPTEDFVQAVDILKKAESRSFDFRQELKLARLAAQKYSGEAVDGDVEVLSLLNLDPALTSEHLHDPLVNLDHLNWSRFGTWCTSAENLAKSSAVVAGLRGYCAFRSGKRDEGVRFLEEALRALPEDAVLNSVFAWMQYEGGRNDLADGALALALKAKDPVELSLLLKAKKCSAMGDKACAAEYFKRLQDRSSQSLPALAGFARLSIEAGQPKEALALIKEGLVLSPNYMPLLRLKREIQ